MKIFIVEGSEVIRNRLSSVLSEIQNVETIGHAQKPVEAVNFIKKLKPHVVILDIRIPGRGGIDVIKYIKEGNPDHMIIMFTNYPYPQHRKKCLERGANFIVDKSSVFKKFTEVFTNLAHDPQNCMKCLDDTDKN